MCKAQYWEESTCEGDHVWAGFCPRQLTLTNYLTSQMVTVCQQPSSPAQEGSIPHQSLFLALASGHNLLV